MEENQGETSTQAVQEAQQSEQTSSNVSFPTIGQNKKSGAPKTLLVLGILILVGILGFAIFKSSSNKTEPKPTPTVSTAPVETPSPSPTSTVKPVDKGKIKVQVQNGTGIPGEAAYLQTQLKSLGYTNVNVGNAGTQDETVTTVTFSKSPSSDVVDEITKKLKEIYKEVEVKTSSTSATDVLIVTGLKKGSTAKPSASPTIKASATPTPTASVSPTPTATPL